MRCKCGLWVVEDISDTSNQNILFGRAWIGTRLPHAYPPPLFVPPTTISPPVPILTLYPALFKSAALRATPLPSKWINFLLDPIVCAIDWETRNHPSYSLAHADGPVLTTTDLYLLGCSLALHPILTHSFGGFHLILNLASGRKSSLG